MKSKLIESSEELMESLEKAKNLTKLIKKQIINKSGKMQTVYVKPAGAEKKDQEKGKEFKADPMFEKERGKRKAKFGDKVKIAEAMSKKHAGKTGKVVDVDDGVIDRYYHIKVEGSDTPILIDESQLLSGLIK